MHKSLMKSRSERSSRGGREEEREKREGKEGKRREKMKRQAKEKMSVSLRGTRNHGPDYERSMSPSPFFLASSFSLSVRYAICFTRQNALHFTGEATAHATLLPASLLEAELRRSGQKDL